MTEGILQARAIATHSRRLPIIKKALELAINFFDTRQRLFHGRRVRRSSDALINEMLWPGSAWIVPNGFGASVQTGWS
jgi:hypothetical protein